MSAPTEPVLNPMQQAVVDTLGKSPDWTPLPSQVIDSVRSILHDQLADVATRFSKDAPLWVSKQRLNTIHGCEAHHLATKDTFAWTPLTARGTVLHKAVELGVHWRGESTPADIVDEAIARLSDSSHNAADFLVSMSPGDQAQLRSYAVDMYTLIRRVLPQTQTCVATCHRIIIAIRVVRRSHRVGHAIRPHLGNRGSKSHHRRKKRWAAHVASRRFAFLRTGRSTA